MIGVESSMLSEAAGQGTCDAAAWEKHQPQLGALNSRPPGQTTQNHVRLAPAIQYNLN